MSTTLASLYLCISGISAVQVLLILVLLWVFYNVCDELPAMQNCSALSSSFSTLLTCLQMSHRPPGHRSASGTILLKKSSHIASADIREVSKTGERLS